MLGEQLDLLALKELDAAAWNQAFEVLWPIACWEARQTGLTDQDAEEVAQESLTQLVTGLERVATTEHLVRLLLDIAKCRALDWHRRHWAEKRGAKLTVSLQAEELTTGQPWDPPSDSPSPRDAAMRLDVLRTLATALEPLGEPDRSLLQGCYIAGKTYAELSVEFNLSPGTVASKIGRGLAKIRTVLKRSQRLWEGLRGQSR